MRACILTRVCELRSASRFIAHNLQICSLFGYASTKLLCKMIRMFSFLGLLTNASTFNMCQVLTVDCSGLVCPTFFSLT